MSGSEEETPVSDEPMLPPAVPEVPAPPMPAPVPQTPEETEAAEREALLATVRSTLSPGVRDAIATAVRVYADLGEPDSVEAFGAWIARLPW